MCCSLKSSVNETKTPLVAIATIFPKGAKNIAYKQICVPPSGGTQRG